MWNSAASLNTIATVALWITAMCGGVAVVSGLIGSLSANRASDIAQRDAKLKIALAHARAEEARLEALKLKQGLAWRELRQDQRAALIKHLRGRVSRVYNTFVGDDPEATQYRHQLDAALREAGVETLFFSGWKQAGGISVLGEDTAERRALSDALRAAGIEHEVEEPNQSFGRDHPALVIGTKWERL